MEGKKLLLSREAGARWVFLCCRVTNLSGFLQRGQIRISVRCFALSLCFSAQPDSTICGNPTTRVEVRSRYLVWYNYFSVVAAQYIGLLKEQTFQLLNDSVKLYMQMNRFTPKNWEKGKYGILGNVV